MTQQEEKKYWIASVTQLKAEVQNYTIAPEKLNAPSRHMPAVDKKLL
jgi:hypothetical protein